MILKARRRVTLLKSLLTMMHCKVNLNAQINHLVSEFGNEELLPKNVGECQRALRSAQMQK